MAEVVLKNVYKKYVGERTKKKDIKNLKPAVSDFSMDIKDGEFVVFVGPSGCGKSTTLRMIAGLEEITAGDIYIGGKLVNDIEPKDRDIAMVFQNYALYPHLTVYGNMSFGLKLNRHKFPKLDKNGKQVYEVDKKQINKLKAEIKKLKKENKNYSAKQKQIDELIKHPSIPSYVLRKYNKAEINEKVMESARILEITEFLKRKPKELSGGQRQRVAIGRAFVRKPKVFLMDEPLSNLDAKLRNQMRSEILLLHEKIKTTFIYVTHDQTEAMTLGDRIVVMKDGFIQQIGTPKEVFKTPANLFVAGFIGTPQMNFLDAKITNDCKVKLLGKTLTLPKDKIEKLKKIKNVSSKEFVLGIRPENILITNSKDGFKAKVQVSEMMGNEYHVHCLIGDTKIVIRTPFTGSDIKVIKAIENNEEIKFVLDTNEIHLFDKSSGKSI